MGFDDVEADGGDLRGQHGEGAVGSEIGPFTCEWSAISTLCWQGF
jgi:hypothetical protein